MWVKLFWPAARNSQGIAAFLSADENKGGKLFENLKIVDKHATIIINMSLIAIRNCSFCSDLLDIEDSI